MRKESRPIIPRLLALAFAALFLAGCATDRYSYDRGYYEAGYGGGYTVDEVVYGGSPSFVVGATYASDYWYDPFWYLGPSFALSYRYVPTFYASRWGYPFYADYYWHHPVPRFGRLGFAPVWYSPAHPRFVPVHVRDDYGWRPSRARTAREAVRLSQHPPRRARPRDLRGFDRDLGPGDVRRPKAQSAAAAEAARLSALRSRSAGPSGVYVTRSLRTRAEARSRASDASRSAPASATLRSRRSAASEPVLRRMPALDAETARSLRTRAGSREPPPARPSPRSRTDTRAVTVLPRASVEPSARGSRVNAAPQPRAIAPQRTGADRRTIRAPRTRFGTPPRAAARPTAPPQRVQPRGAAPTRLVPPSSAPSRSAAPPPRRATRPPVAPGRRYQGPSTSPRAAPPPTSRYQAAPRPGARSPAPRPRTRPR